MINWSKPIYIKYVLIRSQYMLNLTQSQQSQLKYKQKQYEFMSKDLNKIQNTSITIQFSQIRCKIHRQDETFISLVIKIGKNSSKYTEKKLLNNNFIEFKEVLKVNMKQKQLFKENGHPNKCEILFYRMTTQFEQQKSSVIGIASLKITNDMFVSQAKKVRITNTFDKEAFLECRIKIYPEQTDLMSNETDFSSAAGQQSDYAINGYELQKSEGSSFLMAQKSTIPQIDQGQISRQRLIQNFPKLKRNINQIDNSYLRKINQRQNIESQRSSRRGSIVRNQSSIISGRSRDKDQRIQSIQLLKTCKQLENQNNLLIDKIIKIQNNLSLKQAVKTEERKSLIRKNSRQQNKSQMIKKNSKIKNQSCIIEVKRQTQKQSEMANMFYIGQLQKLQQKGVYCETQREQKFIDLAEQQSFDRLYNDSMQQAPNCESRKILQLQHQQSLTYLAVPDCAKQMTESLNCTFADERKNPKSQMLDIMKVLSLTIMPEKQNNQHSNTLIANKSVSEIERSHTRSYSKFNERKKSHQKIGAVRKSSYEEQNLPIQFRLNSSNFNGQQMKIPFVVQKDEIDHEKNFEKDSFEVKSNRFLDENDELGPMIRQLNIKVKQKKKSKNNKRVNLQQVYQNMKERYLKNQRDLRKVNELLLNENKRLKQVQKQLKKQLLLKRQLEIEDFNRIKDQTVSLQRQIEEYVKVIQQKDIHIHFSVLKYEQLQKQCHKLKKDLKQQKQAASYFVKLNNMMDEKQKGKQKQKQKQKNSFNRSHSQILLNQSQLSVFNGKNNSPEIQSSAEKKRAPQADPYQKNSMLNLNDLYASTNSIDIQLYKKDQKKQLPKGPLVQKDAWKNGRLQRIYTLPQSSEYIKDFPDSHIDRRVNNHGSRQKISNPGSPVPENNPLGFFFTLN